MDQKIKFTKIVTCQGHKKNGDDCINLSSFYYNGKYFCCVHKPKNNLTGKIIRLKVDPQIAIDRQNAYMKHMKTVKKHDRKGKIIMENLNFGTVPVYMDGCYMIFANKAPRHKGYGIHMPDLSPMIMGPIIHNKAVSRILENWWKSCKVYDFEIDHDSDSVKKTFYETQKKWMNLDKVNLKKSKFYPKEPKKSFDKVNMKFVLFPNDDKRYTYIDSRSVYVKLYKQYATKTVSYRKLVKLLNDGYDICLCSYNSIDTNNELSLSDIKKRMNDPDKSFGHEFVLYSMLMNYNI